MKKIGIISARAAIFENYVRDIYKRSRLPKSFLNVGGCISIMVGKQETQYFLIQYVSDVKGNKFNEFKVLFGAETLDEYALIMQEVEFGKIPIK